jgi:hypothetical protein
MEKEIQYPLFLFENIHDDNRLGGRMEGMYSSIEGLNVGLESWMVNENLFKAYDAQGKLLTLTTEWRKIKENGLFGKCTVNREFIKVSFSDNPIIRADTLKKFLQFNLSDTINHFKNMLEKHNFNQFKLKLETGLLRRTQKIIKDEFINLIFVDDDVIHMKFEFLKRLMLDFINNLLKNNLIDKMELIDLATLAGQLWVYDDRGNGTCIENQF